MAKQEYYRITDAQWDDLKSALGSDTWRQLHPDSNAIVKALGRAGYAERSTVDLGTASDDIAADLDALQSAGFKASAIAAPEIVVRSLSNDLRSRLVDEGIDVRVQKTAQTWRILTERK